MTASVSAFHHSPEISVFKIVYQQIWIGKLVKVDIELFFICDLTKGDWYLLVRLGKWIGSVVFRENDYGTIKSCSKP